MPSPRLPSTDRSAYPRILRRSGAAETVRWLSAHRLAEPLGASAGRVFHLIARASPLGDSPGRRAASPRRRTSRKGPVPLSHLTDGDRLTMWETPERQRRGHQLRLTLACTATLQSVGAAPGRRPLRAAPGNRSVGGRDALATGLGRNDGWTGRSGGAARSPAAMDRYPRRGRRRSGDSLAHCSRPIAAARVGGGGSARARNLRALTQRLPCRRRRQRQTRARSARGWSSPHRSGRQPARRQRSAPSPDPRTPDRHRPARDPAHGCGADSTRTRSSSCARRTRSATSA